MHKDIAIFRRSFFACSVLLLALVDVEVRAAESLQNLRDLPLDRLKDVKVSSVSKRLESRFQAPAAVTVITAEEIKRSGAKSIPEVLRQVPGLEVAQIDSNKWAISSRGFNRQFANKLLVLVDGRSVYTPLFAGTYWDIQDTLLEDIDRIEVIRGPGASLWGANAVNGIINIITKSSITTVGNYASAVVGNYERGTLSFRHGDKLNDNFYYRAFGKYLSRDEFRRTLTSDGANDDWEAGRIGYRADWFNDKNTHTISLDAYSGKEDRDYFFPGSPKVPGSEEMLGVSALYKLQHVHSENSLLTFSTYFDYAQRDMTHVLDQVINTINFDFQHDWKWSEGNEINWGMEYRNISDHLTSFAHNNIVHLDYTPDKESNNLYTAFFQNRTALIPETLYLTLGSKFEKNYYTDFEYQPSIKVAWYPNDKQTLWGSVSRAIRIPSRGERGISLAAARVGGTTLFFKGSPNYDSERLYAYEAGYRIRPVAWADIDLAAYYNDYDQLRSFEPNGTPNIPLANNGNGVAKGFEISSRLLFSDSWNLELNYSYLDFDLTFDRGSRDNISKADEKTSPKDKISLLSRYNVNDAIQLDSNLFYVGALPAYKISSYWRFDQRLGWSPIENLEISLVGQNLFDAHHKEFNPFLFSNPIEIGRSIFLEIAYNF